MSQISRTEFSVRLAVSCRSAPCHSPSVGIGRAFAGRFEAVGEPVDRAINRATKGDRAAQSPPVAGEPTRTIAMRPDSLADTSVLVRIPDVPDAPTPAAGNGSAIKPAKDKTARTARWRWPASHGQRADRNGQADAAGALRDVSASPPRTSSPGLTGAIQYS